MDDPHYRHGIELFNAGRFFDAHEELEDAWRVAAEDDRLFLQGLTQAAVGLHHHSCGNRTGACSVLERARGNLGGYPARYAGIRVEELRQALGAFSAALLACEAAPPVPRIEWAE